jgi:malate/lactate dehydrogenase
MGDIVLFDVAEGIPQGKALDLAQAGRSKASTRGSSAPTTMRTSPGGRLHRHRRDRPQARA